VRTYLGLWFLLISSWAYAGEEYGEEDATRLADVVVDAEVVEVLCDGYREAVNPFDKVYSESDYLARLEVLNWIKGTGSPEIWVAFTVSDDPDVSAYDCYQVEDPLPLGMTGRMFINELEDGSLRSASTGLILVSKTSQEEPLPVCAETEPGDEQRPVPSLANEPEAEPVACQSIPLGMTAVWWLMLPLLSIRRIRC